MVSTLNKTVTLGQLALLINAELQGEPTRVITGVGTLQKAQSGQVSFLHSAKYRRYLATTQASAVIVSPADVKHCVVDALVSNNPYLSYARAAQFFDATPRPFP